MQQIAWKNFISQERIKDVLGSAFESGALGHAYFFCGASGTGKFAAAVELAMALLCTSSDQRPCYTCPSCRKILNFSHPDLHILMPLALQKEHRSSDGKLNDEGWDFASSTVKQRIADPYRKIEYSGIPTIPVEWMREINHAVMRGPLESKMNIAILDGVDYMSKESANAMLKTLEEPPAGTVMLLISDRIHSVLPTILSRCQILRFSFIPPEVIRQQIASRFSVDPNDSRMEEIIYTGSLGQSIAMFENPVEEVSKDAAEFWRLCVEQNWSLLARTIDRLSALDNFGIYEKLFSQIIRLIRNSFLKNFSGTENYIMGNRSQLIELKMCKTPEQIEGLVELCEKAIGQIRVRANISLVLVNFGIAVMEIFNGEKQ
ncbi:MAG: hypothetical protein GX640_17350 [Fibrobacter sp.]|nr:hypothetical protein [Fibrobacter sp.]